MYRKEFDIAISAKTSPMKLTNFFLYWLQAKERIAYVDNSWHKSLINRPIKYQYQEAQTKHQALKGLQTIAPQLKDVPEECYPTLHIPSEIRERYPQPIVKKPIILISATTTNPLS